MALRAEKRGIHVREDFIDYAAPSNSPFGDEGLLIKAKQRKDDFRKAAVDPALVK